MPHELSIREDGTVEMMYVGETPWTGLGTKLLTPATSKEAIEAAHLNWPIITNPVYRNVSVAQFEQIPNMNAIVRLDTQTVFQVASNKYTPLQNVDAFKFFDAVVGSGQAIYHTAGALFGGRRVWILAKLPGELRVTDNDILEKYILLVNSHDGTHALTMKFTPIRVVCNNTLSVALHGNSQSFYARHTPSIINRVVEARELLGLSEAYFENFMLGANKLVEKEFTRQDMNKFVFDLFELDVSKTIDEQRKNKEYAAEKVLDLFSNGRGNNLDGVTNTAWAAWNSVAEYSDYFSPVGHSVKTGLLNTPEVAAKRLGSSWFGRGALLKQKSWDMLLNLDKFQLVA
ncbi:MAG: DUF932 domain-containing protein [Nanoarchaeota archaeon]